jgi:hypothetical protein
MPATTLLGVSRHPSSNVTLSLIDAFLDAIDGLIELDTSTTTIKNCTFVGALLIHAHSRIISVRGVYVTGKGTQFLIIKRFANLTLSQLVFHRYNSTYPCIHLSDF